jgi:hypothetical protein
MLGVQKSLDVWKFGIRKLKSVSSNTIENRVQIANDVEENFVKVAGCRVMDWFGLPNLD